MYTAVLTIHSWMRWLTLLLAAAATVNASRSPIEGVKTLPGRWWDTFLMLAVDLQVFFGLVLYFGLSPFTKEALSNVSLAMTNPALRFWALEHAGGMFLSVVLVRMGRVLAANAKTPAAARKRRLTCFAIATLGMLLSIPWPGLANGRPLFRL
jgi:hypothetical protein